MKRYTVIFEYCDSYCMNGKWNRQLNSVVAEDKRDAIDQVIKFNGLGIDCNYRIVSVKEN